MLAAWKIKIKTILATMYRIHYIRSK